MKNLFGSLVFCFLYGCASMATDSNFIWNDKHFFQSEKLKYELVTPEKNEPEWFLPLIEDLSAVKYMFGLNELPSSEESEEKVRFYCLEDNYRSYYQFNEEDFRITYSITTKSGISVGKISVLMMNFDGVLFNNISIYIEKNMREKGYGRESSIAFSNYVFENFSKTTQQWTSDPDNIASKKLAKYAGFNYSHKAELLVYLRTYDDFLGTE